MHSSYSKAIKFIFSLAIIGAAPIAISAQDMPQPGAKTYEHRTASDNADSKWDIFVGFSYLSPQVTSDGFDRFGDSAIKYGAIGSISRYFSKYAGVEFEGDFHNDYNEDHPNTDFAGGSGGLIFRYPGTYFTPFAHVLVGGESAGSYYYPNQWGVVATGGGGLDYNTPLFNHHLALRLFQADYQYNHQDVSDFNMLRLSAGAVIRIGSLTPPPPVSLACAASPDSVFPGDPVTATATAGNLNPKQHAVYSWTGEGVTSEGDGTAAAVATTGLAPGVHTISGKVSEGKGEKIGIKPGEVANCSASFTVKAFEPPTISCAASPSTINPNESSTITASGVSPQNRPLTYSYTAQSGTISGSGATASFSSAGSMPGPVAITCNVTDDKGNTAVAVANITIATPPPPAEQVRLEGRLALHSVFFPTAQPGPAHPTGGLVTSQQAILKTLAEDFKAYSAIKPEAHLILTGHADVRGSEEFNQALTERRVDGVKQFLVDQGIAESNIDTHAVGKEQELSQDEVRDLIQNNPDITEVERQKILHDLTTIVLAQNRRVDITLSTTGQQSVKLYPFNAEDSMTLLSDKATKTKKHVRPNRKHVHAKE